ncbi:MAG TPA: outer membrane protein assembly factor BamD [Gammaproteobacteria bacterium]
MSARELLQKHVLHALILITLSIVVSGCATTPGKTGAKNESSAAKMYSEGKEALSAGKYTAAIKQFSSLEALYPEDIYTQQAQMELAYAYHKNGDTTSAIATAERFIKNYPGHVNADYAYYLRGLTSFEQAISQLSDESPRETQRRPLIAQLSLQYLTELIELFPDSKYSSDAARRVAFLKDRLAQYEVLLAKRNLEEGQYANAALHAKAAIENYPQTPAIPEAVAITNQAYKALEIKPAPGLDNASQTVKGAADKMVQHETIPPVGQKPSFVIPFRMEEDQGKKQAPADTAPPASQMTGSASAVSQKPATTAAEKTVETPIQEKTVIKREQWILSQDPARYTIQLLGTGSEQLLIALIKRLNLTDKAAYYKNPRSEKAWYALTYGEFSSIAEANAAINQLPEDLIKGQPWIRKFGDIQALLAN